MEILGIGAPEFVFIIIIALIVLGPKDMQKAGKTVGRWLNNLIRSDGWKVFQQTSHEIRTLPTKLMREANMEMMETEKEIRKAMDTTKAPASSLNRGLSHPQETEYTIQTPPATPPETKPDTDQHA
ncbi:MAG: twin-arginine translocase TatA/TatE family subunit [Anaerolineales bacterium]|nr:twin-arginine translocase TatA/TatE family subunit [Anaerolineales bacterium]